MSTVAIPPEADAMYRRVMATGARPIDALYAAAEAVQMTPTELITATLREPRPKPRKRRRR